RGVLVEFGRLRQPWCRCLRLVPAWRRYLGPTPDGIYWGRYRDVRPRYQGPLHSVPWQLPGHGCLFSPVSPFGHAYAWGRSQATCACISSPGFVWAASSDNSPASTLAAIKLASLRESAPGAEV